LEWLVVQIIQSSCILSWATFRDLLKSQVEQALPPASEFLETGGKNMSIFAWIILGLLAGFIGSKLVNKSGEGLFLDIILGVVGAVVGGWLFNRFGAVGVTGLNLYSLLVAVIGAVVVLVVYHALRRAV
jgi:uncharacterized membrane protein YeaQ/YmgE (transglycosylase-associated protein family)